MSSYKDLQAQIAELQKRAEEVRGQEMNAALAQVKDLMNQYGITVNDLQDKKATSKKAGKSGSPTVQYKDGDKTWSGRGRAPGWLKNKDREKYRVKE